MRWRFGWEKLVRAERDWQCPRIQCRDEVLERVNLRTEFLEYGARKGIGWGLSDLAIAVNMISMESCP